LPQAVIVHLMSFLDPVSLQCFRRACRVFFLDFQKSLGPCISTLTDSQCMALTALLRHDGYCADCNAARRAPSWFRKTEHATKRYLRCSACRAGHPGCLFTPAQRKAEPRVCVAHTGSIRLCEHKSVTWSQLVAASKKAKLKRGSAQVIAECKKRSHSKTSQSHRLWRVTRPFRKNSNAAPLGPQHPRLYLVNDMTSGIGIKLCWSPHLSLAPIERATICPAKAMTSMFQRLRRHQTKFICPKLGPGQVLEARVFDPNSCGCLMYNQLERLGAGW
ncbi:hypothetical protein QBC44DRAFT_402655, partial [Cladorrhinum sp. PSN332]